MKIGSRASVSVTMSALHGSVRAIQVSRATGAPTLSTRAGTYVAR
jgi:hypothetical protein